MKKIIFLTLMLFVSNANAKWKFVGEGTGGPYYFDSDTITKEGDIKTVLMMTNYNSGGSAVSKMEFNCKEERYTGLNIKSYSEANLGGTLKGEEELKAPYSAIPSNTVLETFFKFICVK